MATDSVKMFSLLKRASLLHSKRLCNKTFRAVAMRALVIARAYPSGASYETLVTRLGQKY
jgi:hypothetical protein